MPVPPPATMQDDDQIEAALERAGLLAALKIDASRVDARLRSEAIGRALRGAWHDEGCPAFYDGPLRCEEIDDAVAGRFFASEPEVASPSPAPWFGVLCTVASVVFIVALILLADPAASFVVGASNEPR